MENLEPSDLTREHKRLVQGALLVMPGKRHV